MEKAERMPEGSNGVGRTPEWAGPGSMLCDKTSILRVAKGWGCCAHLGGFVNGLCEAERGWGYILALNPQAGKGAAVCTAAPFQHVAGPDTTT